MLLNPQKAIMPSNVIQIDIESQTQPNRNIPSLCTKSIICNLDYGCPPNFATLERHDKDNEHGDKCRNEKIHGLNIGWVCPYQCSPTKDYAKPYCQMTSNIKLPCRAGKGKQF